MNNLYRRGDMSYVDFWYNKKRYRKCIGPSRKLADKVIAKMKGEIAENRFLDVWKKPDPIKFKDFVDRYYAKNVDIDRRRRSRLDLLKREFGDKVVQEITVFQIERYKMKRQEQVKPASVDREIALIKHVFSKAVEYGMLKEKPARSVKLLKGEVSRVRFLSPEEMNRLIECCDEKIKDPVIVSLNTGFRQGELFGLEWDRVDMERGILTLMKTKSGKRRDVPMNKTVREILEKIGPKREGLVFEGATASFLRKPFAKALKKAGIEDFRWNDLRHCFASNLVFQKKDLNVIRELLGHSTIAMTQRYAHPSPGAKAEAVNSMDDLSASRKPPQEKAERKVAPIRP